jgi:mycothiol synthase
MTSPSSLQISREPLMPLSLPLALALQYWPEAERAAQLEAVRSAAIQEKGEFLLFAARRGADLAGAMLAQQLPGKTATLFPPQCVASETDSSGVALHLLTHAVDSMAAAGVQLCQSLLAKDQAPLAASLSAAGFQRSANLLYMTCEPRQFPAESPLFPGFKLTPFQPGDEAALAQLIDQTYVGTRDCPALNGLRDTLDVVEGYKHVGEFQPDLWLILESPIDSRTESPSTRWAGCLLLVKHPPQPTMELVYVGVVQSFRNQGLGAKLTGHAQWLAGQSQCERLVLAVDAANEPAIATYAATGFWAWDERAIWVKSMLGKG